jgi:flagellar biosynthesis/type III secretory pathway M-ring protein FliF/YscJ
LRSAIIAVIVVVVVVVMIIGSISYILLYRLRKRQKKEEVEKAEQAIESSQPEPVVFEVPGAKNEIFEVSSPMEDRAEMDGHSVDMRHELATPPMPCAELSAVSWG